MSTLGEQYLVPAELGVSSHSNIKSYESERQTCAKFICHVAYHN